ncbi:bifunctional 2',3'-cyclic-nucleotide 2'-phosphodiesterase/3'-nucleotidase [Frateuria aurantia]
MASSPLHRLALATCLTVSLGITQAHGAASSLPAGSSAQVAILETTDLHSNVLSYDYYKQHDDASVGLERVATLIEAARRQYPNTLLFDAGDTIQGTVLADYQALIKPPGCRQELAIYQVMDHLHYDGGTIGNHEFNYGLPFLSQVTGTPMQVEGVPVQHCQGPSMPLVLANLVSLKTGQPVFTPWTMIHRDIKVQLPDGSQGHAPLRIAIIGFTPPPIMQWDHQHLAGKVKVDGLVETARRYLPAIRAQHPDLVIGLVHGGIDSEAYHPDMENGAVALAEVPGFDALLLGHQHAEFPGKHFAGIAQVDSIHGRVARIPAVMADFFGKDLGVISLQLQWQDGHWQVVRDQTQVKLEPICPQAGHCVPPASWVAPLIAEAHHGAQAYVNTPIGSSQIRMTSYFADLGQSPAVAVVNAAQLDYLRKNLSRLRPDLAGLPVLSAAAAFRTGFGGPGDFTDVAAGPLTLRSAADLYFFPNTLAAVKVSGATLRQWLETGARHFNRIDPALTRPQPLINPDYPGFNFDQLQGDLSYRIDVSQPAGQRIVDLRYRGKPVDPAQAFIVATNNYRASGGGHIPGVDASAIVLNAPDGNREILADWLRAHPRLKASDLPAASWQFVPLKTAGPVLLDSAPGEAALDPHQVRQLGVLPNGLASYEVQLAP